MTKHGGWRESMKSYVDPEKEEELKLIQIENENKVSKILKLIKNINQGNREANLKKKSELYQLIDDLQKQHQSIYALYDNLKGEVRKRVVGSKGDGSSTPSASSDDDEFISRSNQLKRGLQKAKDGHNKKLELKDKLTSTNEVVKQAPPLRDTLQEPGKAIEHLANENEEKFLSLSKAHEVHKRETTAQIKELEGQVFILKHELETLGSDNTELREQLECRETEAKQLGEKKLDLQNQISELDATFKRKEDQLCATLNAFQDNEKHSISKIDELVAQANNMQSELDRLDAQKGALEEQLDRDKNEGSAIITGLTDRIDVLQHELESLSCKRSDETEDLKLQAKCVSLNSQKRALEEEMTSMENEANQSRVEKEKLHSRILGLEKRLAEREDEISMLNKSDEEHKQCEGKLMELKYSVQLVEKKFEEASEDFRKKFEDNLRIMSRRIRVAEELHVESKEWYRETREKHEQDSKELVVSLKKIKDISLSANDMLTALDAMTLRFEDSSAHFINRISKVFCQLKRKNKAMDDLLAQLNDKEAQVLGFREKVWGLENKVREVERIVQQKEEGMVSLGEEKREAIRQLCVWTDYHRTHSHHLKKLLNHVTKRNQNAA